MRTLTPDMTACNGSVGMPFRAHVRPVQASSAGGKGQGRGSLGNSAKSCANPMEYRVARFSLQSVARSILPKSRTAKCLRIRAFDSDIQIWQSAEHGTAFYGGLQTCGSVWACPVCAAKIAERRRAELQSAMALHKASGGCVNLLTLTTPHQKTDRLADLLDMQAKALHRFWRDRAVVAVFKEMGTVGHVRAVETTHGRKSESNNGWHPHYHCLIFGGVGVDLKRFDASQLRDWRVRLYLRWAACCVKSGLGEPSFDHGLRLDGGEKAGNYVVKWGLEDEMTKGHTKKALHGETPFDFLRAYLADPTDRQAAALFKEFAETFKGRRQLSWSKGLKARFAIEDATDDDLSNRPQDAAILLGLVTPEQWADVLRVDGRATVLEISASGGWDRLQRYFWFIQGASKGVQIDADMLAEVRYLLL